MTLRLLALPTLMLCAAFTFGQITVNGSAAPRKLSEVAEPLLGKPKVLVAIKATDEQLSRASMRMVMGPLRELMKQRMADENNENLSLPWESLSWNSSQVKVIDLSPTQTKRLYQIALREKTLRSLLTDEMALALNVSPKQRAQLQAIYANVMAKGTKATLNSPETKTLNKTIAKMQGMVKPEDESPSLEQMNKVFDVFTDLFPRLMSAIDRRTDAFWKDGDRRALRVLTSSQRSQLLKLEGKPLG